MAHTDFSSVVDQITDYAIYAMDIDGRVASWNRGAERLKGYRANEIIGEHFSRFYTPEDKAIAKPARGLILARQNGGYKDEGWRVRKDGSHFWASCVITPIIDMRGEVSGFVKVTRDLTERKLADEKLQRSEERYRMLIAEVRDYAIFALDSQGQIASWNSGAVQIEGYSAGEAIGRHFSLFYLPADNAADKPQRLLDLALREDRASDEGWLVRKDGSRYWADVIISPLRDDRTEHIGFVVIARDLTERIAIQEERTLRQIAEAGLRERDAFLSLASHEIRSPLSALKLYIQTTLEELRQGKTDRVLQKLPARLDSVQRQANRIDALLDRLMSASALAAGRLQLNLEELDLAELACAAVGDLSETAHQAKCEITVEAPGAMVGHWSPEHLEDVILNLLHNAMKFGAGKPINVTVGGDDQDAWIAVADHGIGIASAEQERIFERFHRAADSRNYGGLGLGLWISHRIVNAMGGKIAVESRPGEGATFTITLPRLPHG
ncbi:MAG TPA: PAS domain-containing sensor histidine kinase [Candidatus Binataceae bacterium]|nr:PAS domain-containing sensor histidine kinase [Candidatus Binataceae bacterium]